jgi:hypothetical protein
MVLGGLWHGASWTFVIWGSLHGLYLWVNHLWTERHYRMPAFAAWPLTFLLTTAAWVFFRAPSFSRAADFFTAMAGLNGFSFNAVQDAIGWHELGLIGAGLAIALFCPNRQTILTWHWRSDWLWAGAFAILAGLSIMGMANAALYILPVLGAAFAKHSAPHPPHDRPYRRTHRGSDGLQLLSQSLRRVADRLSQSDLSKPHWRAGPDALSTADRRTRNASDR